MAERARVSMLVRASVPVGRWAGRGEPADEWARGAAGATAGAMAGD